MLQFLKRTGKTLKPLMGREQLRGIIKSLLKDSAQIHFAKFPEIIKIWLDNSPKNF